MLRLNQLQVRTTILSIGFNRTHVLYASRFRSILLYVVDSVNCIGVSRSQAISLNQIIVYHKLQAYKDTVQQLQSMQIRSEVYSMMHTPKISTIHKTHTKQAHAPKNTAANPIHDQQRHTPKAGTTHIATRTMFRQRP